MVLVTHQDIEQFTGFTYTDFTNNGQPMSQDDWNSFINDLVPKVTQMIHRYCNVYSFEVAPFTEYHSGMGATNYDTAVEDYDFNEDQVFFLHQLYSDSLVIMEDIADKGSVPNWVTRFARPKAATAEADTVTFTNRPLVSGPINITLNGDFTYAVTMTAGMSLSAVCGAIVAAGTHTDTTGMVWTPTTDGIANVTFTAGLTGAANTVTVAPLNTNISCYVTQTVPGGGASGGDYEFIQENDVTRVFFYCNIPMQGHNNVKFTYNTGYPAASAQLKDIRLQTLRAVDNLLLHKKKIQEAVSIRNYGTRDYSQMFDVFSESVVLDEKVKAALSEYRRDVVPGSWAYH